MESEKEEITKKDLEKLKEEIKKELKEELKEENKEEIKKDIYVCTENDYCNEGGFHILKDQVKKLPNKLSLELTKALEQGLLKEVSEIDLARAKEEGNFAE